MVAELAVGSIPAHEPEAGGYLGVEEELGGEVDDAVYEVGFDELLADFSFVVSLCAERAFGEDKACLTLGGEVVEEVLYPGVVSISCWGDAVLPAGVIAEQLSAPVTGIEGWIGDDEVYLGISVGIL